MTWLVFFCHHYCMYLCNDVLFGCTRDNYSCNRKITLVCFPISLRFHNRMVGVSMSPITLCCAENGSLTDCSVMPWLCVYSWLLAHSLVIFTSTAVEWGLFGWEVLQCESNCWVGCFCSLVLISCWTVYSSQLSTVHNVFPQQQRNEILLASLLTLLQVLFSIYSLL